MCILVYIGCRVLQEMLTGECVEKQRAGDQVVTRKPGARDEQPGAGKYACLFYFILDFFVASHFGSSCGFMPGILITVAFSAELASLATGTLTRCGLFPAE